VKKRSFLQLLSAALASPVLAPLFAWLAQSKLTNWAGNLTYSTGRLEQAASVEQVRTLLRSHDKVKVLGTRHCFNSIADSRYNLLSLKPMHQVIALDAVARTVTVEAGVTYGQLGPTSRARASRCTTWLHCRTSRSPAHAAPRRTDRARRTAISPAPSRLSNS